MDRFYFFLSKHIRDAISISLHRVIAGAIQRLVEEDTTEKTVYDMLRGKKISNESRYYTLIILINVLFYIDSTVCILFNIISGINATNVTDESESYNEAD